MARGELQDKTIAKAVRGTGITTGTVAVNQEEMNRKKTGRMGRGAVETKGVRGTRRRAPERTAELAAEAVTEDLERKVTGTEGRERRLAEPLRETGRIAATDRTVRIATDRTNPREDRTAGETIGTGRAEKTAKGVRTTGMISPRREAKTIEETVRIARGRTNPRGGKTPGETTGTGRTEKMARGVRTTGEAAGTARESQETGITKTGRADGITTATETAETRKTGIETDKTRGGIIQAE